MKYERIKKAKFIERPNRFIAYAEVDGKRTVIHVKNTGRCKELLIPGTDIYVQHNPSSSRKTEYDLIAVRKGNRIINMDSQIPNAAVEEWIRKGNLITDMASLTREYTFGQSRIDLYVQNKKGDKYLIEVKGVTLEENNICLFPDAPSERAVKHVEELIRARREGYETYIFFLIQMSGIDCFIPNEATHPAFADALVRAKKEGVGIVAYESRVSPDEIEITREVPVVLAGAQLVLARDRIVDWYRENRRDLPWRRRVSAYHVWISEIMLQQTRVEAVKPYYERFISELPDVKALAAVPDDELMKLWEGLGYYSRARNLKEAANQIMDCFGGVFPDRFEDILSLKGIGSYTAGAVSAFAFGKPYPAVDGNVLRVVSRLLGMEDDVMLSATKKKIEEIVASCIPENAAGDFNQGLIELGALVCLPAAQAKCGSCPVNGFCRAYKEGRVQQLPVRIIKTKKRVEKRTVFRIKCGGRICIGRRPEKGLLAGLYELPNVEGHLTPEEALCYMKNIGLPIIRFKDIGRAVHVFSHVKWDMIGYEMEVDEIDVGKIQFQRIDTERFFVSMESLETTYAIPSAFAAYMPD